MSQLSEYDAFKRLTDCLNQAASAAKTVAAHRPDQSLQWDKVAEALNVVAMSVYKLAEEGVLRHLKQ